MRAPKGFSEGKPEASKPKGRGPRGFAAKGLAEQIPREPSHCPAAQFWLPRHRLGKNELHEVAELNVKKNIFRQICLTFCQIWIIEHAN